MRETHITASQKNPQNTVVIMPMTSPAVPRPLWKPFSLAQRLPIVLNTMASMDGMQINAPSQIEKMEKTKPAVHSPGVPGFTLSVSTGTPQCGQITALSSISLPQFLQYLSIFSSSRIFSSFIVIIMTIVKIINIYYN